MSLIELNNYLQIFSLIENNIVRTGGCFNCFLETKIPFHFFKLIFYSAFRKGKWIALRVGKFIEPMFGNCFVHYISSFPSPVADLTLS